MFGVLVFWGQLRDFEFKQFGVQGLGFEVFCTDLCSAIFVRSFFGGLMATCASIHDLISNDNSVPMSM